MGQRRAVDTALENTALENTALENTATENTAPQDTALNTAPRETALENTAVQGGAIQVSALAGPDSPELPVLRGRGLRFVLVEHIRENQTVTVSQLAAVIARYGYDLPGRASKVISDALRWEVARGRVVRTARGVYSYGTAPATTARRIRRFANHCNTWIVAKRRNEPTPPTPTAPAYRMDNQHWFPEDPNRPPWVVLRWLWTT